METVIEIAGVNGDTVVLSGNHVGEDGMWLASDVSGFYDPEIETNTRNISNRPGTSYVSHRILERTLIFKVTISNDEGLGNTWRERDARWRKLWHPRKLTGIRVITDEGMRTLKVRLEEIEVDTKYDPHTNGATDVTMTVVADDPFWYAPDEIHEVTVNGTATLQVLMANPTSNPVYPEWVLEAPGQWTLPDWGEDHPDKVVPLPHVGAGAHLVVDTDPAARQLQSVNQDPVWARMNGVRFRGVIPEYTGKIDFKISVDADGPRQAQLRLARPFDRPWGA